METIKMGNDEFILYVRKRNKECSLTNEVLGRRIWEWIRDNDDKARQINEKTCLWEKDGSNVSAELLPKTATQFEFKRELLVPLYNFLDNIE